ncbi:alphaK A6 [Puccinia sorghi]|uniref:AlphaK A6 n=1 Tax=Puccinia sorghi TaxID=27349 RepID=A0A0L6UER6_9BASI|nr:alphaK A6 [Puccinia sorghi]
MLKDPRLECIKTDVDPIELMAHEDQIIGEGITIFNYFAKIQHKENPQSLSNHALDARMYQASALKLKTFGTIISESQLVKEDYKNSCSKNGGFPNFLLIKSLFHKFKIFLF